MQARYRHHWPGLYRLLQDHRPVADLLVLEANRVGGCEIVLARQRLPLHLESTTRCQGSWFCLAINIGQHDFQAEVHRNLASECFTLK